jgi:hypothetical protein
MESTNMENIILVHNCETGKIAEVEMTSEQVAQNAIEAEKYDERIATRRAKKEALLDKLGLTAEEASLLLG